MIAELIVGEPERVAGGCAWAEGPVWTAEGRVRWSDIPNDRILEFDPASGRTSTYAQPAGFPNGRTLDRAGEVVQCSHGGRRVERDRAGTVEPIVDRFEGHRLNSPNDVVVSSDGAIWFTDPPYGILPGTVEGHEGAQEYGGCFVFRYDEATGELRAVVTDMTHPNGLAFSPDEGILYVADTGVGHGVIRAYDVVDGTCTGGREFARISPGVSDGVRVDVEGRIWSSAGDGVHVLTPKGVELLRIPVPEPVSNLCFGGDDGHDLYLTATTSLYRMRTSTTDAAARTRGITASEV